MEYPFFLKDGELLPVSEAVIPLSHIEYAYGFGVYETIRVTHGTPRFLKDHIERLFVSAHTIGLEHSLSETVIAQGIAQLIEKNNVDTCNLKILLIGGASPRDAHLYILCLSPLFPDKKLYKEGVHCITYSYERLFPQAKTLNMLGSYLAYREAKRKGAYEALLLNREGHITEGTRTNIFCMQGTTIISPPEKDILAGVTRKKMLEVAIAHHYTLEEKTIAPADLSVFDCAFLTSTSSKILPIRSVDDLKLRDIPESLQNLMQLFEKAL